MSDEDDVVERAAEIVGAEIDRSALRLFADYLDVQHRMATEIFPLMEKVCGQLLEFAKLCEGLDEWEDEQVAALEEDFWSRRSVGVEEPQ